MVERERTQQRRRANLDSAVVNCLLAVLHDDTAHELDLASRLRECVHVRRNDDCDSVLLRVQRAWRLLRKCDSCLRRVPGPCGACVLAQLDARTRRLRRRRRRCEVSATFGPRRRVRRVSGFVVGGVLRVVNRCTRRGARQVRSRRRADSTRRRTRCAWRRR